MEYWSNNWRIHQRGRKLILPSNIGLSKYLLKVQHKKIELEFYSGVLYIFKRILLASASYFSNIKGNKTLEHIIE